MSNWLEWHGGECPIDPDTIVDVRFDDGSIDTDFAGCWDWSSNGLLAESDITAYRVSKLNSGPVIEPVSGQPGWFNISGATRDYDHFASEVGETAASYVAECFRTHLGEEAAREDRGFILALVVRLIRAGALEARVRLDENATEARFSFNRHYCPTCYDERVLH